MVKVLFESDYFEKEHFHNWEDACKELGVDYKVASRQSWYASDDVATFFDLEEDVAVFGSIQFFQFVQQKRKSGEILWNIVNPITWDNYRCTHYYPHFGRCLLNQDYCMLPYGELDRRKKDLFDRFGNNDCIFIRPDDGEKSFSGTVLAKNAIEWKRSMELLGFYDDMVKPHTLCVVSEPRNIVREWRFVLAPHKDGGFDTITGSLYKENRKVKLENVDGKWDLLSSIEPDTFAFAIANQMHEGKAATNPWSPDPFYTMDICETKDGGYYLMEINSLGSSGMYECNRKTILERITK